MTTLIIVTALLAIAVTGAWSWLRLDQARKHTKRRASEENERIANEKLVARVREKTHAQAEAEKRNRRETQAKEDAQLAEKQLVAEKPAAEAETKQRVEVEVYEKACVTAEEVQRAEVRRQAEAQAEARPVTPPPDEPPIQDRKAVSAVAVVPEEHESEAALPKQAKPDRERASVSPEDRGGRSRETVPKKEGGSEKKRRTHTPKPEIVCWKREREWIPAVELPDDFLQGQNVTVVQDGKPLEIDETENGCWRLALLHGEVVVRVTDPENQRMFKLPLGDDGCLIFKLSGEDRGRHVKHPGSGLCLAVVPQDWKRDEALAGPPCIAPEDVCLSGCRAHFFELCNAVKIAFRDQSDRSVVIGSSGPLFQFVGEQVPDTYENLGPLFVGAPPRVCVVNETWDSVRTIILGEEGRGAGKWRKAFRLNPDLTEQTMPVELTDRQAGWYFVRFYDHEDELIDSLDFRFCAGLRKVRIQQCQLFPHATGHDTATVELEHDSEWHLTPSFVSQDGVMIERMNDGTTLKIPPRPDLDLTRWRFGVHGGPQIETALLIERVWWAAGDTGVPPLQWGDTSLDLSVDDFVATSNKAIWLRLPKPRWTNCVFAGFQPEQRRPYALRVTEQIVGIPLRDFSDAPALADRTKDCALKVWISGSEGVIATIPGEPAEMTLDVNQISPCRLAHTLTLLHATSRGPMRRLIKETRRRYRRPWRPSAGHNTEFVWSALCVLAVILQEADSTPLSAPSVALRWKPMARLAAKQFPDAMQQAWRRLRELEGHTPAGKPIP
jgi:hypothetical protein